NTPPAGDQEFSGVAMDANGNSVVTWQSNGQDGSSWGIFGQRCDANGLAVGGEFQVTSVTVGDQKRPSVSMDALGNFFITWQSYAQDGTGWNISAQEYFASGTANGGEYVVNSTLSGDQQFASVAMDSSGQAVIVWSGNGSGDGAGVFHQRYTLNQSSPDPDRLAAGPCWPGHSDNVLPAAVAIHSETALQAISGTSAKDNEADDSPPVSQRHQSLNETSPTPAAVRISSYLPSDLANVPGPTTRVRNSAGWMSVDSIFDDPGTPFDPVADWSLPA